MIMLVENQRSNHLLDGGSEDGGFDTGNNYNKYNAKCKEQENFKVEVELVH